MSQLDLAVQVQDSLQLECAYHLCFANECTLLASPSESLIECLEHRSTHRPVCIVDVLADRQECFCQMCHRTLSFQKSVYAFDRSVTATYLYWIPCKSSDHQGEGKRCIGFQGFPNIDLRLVARS